LSCELWQSGCGNCPKLETYPSVKIDNTKKMLAYKMRLLKKINPTIVCPSKWLAERVKEAYPFLKTVKMIPNGVDTEVFKPMDKNELRNKLGLPKDALIILFAAELATKNPFKGGEIVESLIEKSIYQNCYFVTIGGETIKKSENHIPFGYISEQEKMAELYAASDIMLYPTRADNLPLVVLEAMSCGLPVISSNLGGIAEIIENEKNGFLIDDYFKMELFEEAILKFMNFTERERFQISFEARKTIIDKFSKEQMISGYDELYELDNQNI
jgi:glycosyltransferase involved in cell wall biosynthesis